MNENEVKVENRDPETLVLMPLVDILDGTDGVTIWFEIPGANSKTVHIEVKDKIMSMTAASSLRRNGQPIVFKREFQLSDSIDVEKITAKTQFTRSQSSDASAVRSDRAPGGKFFADFPPFAFKRKVFVKSSLLSQPPRAIFPEKSGGELS